MGAPRVLGLILIAIGAALMVAITTGVGGEVIVLTIGLGFLIAYAATRLYGLLIPGAILTGLGTGIVVAAQGAPGESVVLGLGIGFVVIAVVDVFVGNARSGWWWPLIPGGVLTTVGALTISGLEEFGAYIVPSLLILIGLVLLFRWRPSRTRPEAQTPPPHEPTPDAPAPAPQERQAPPEPQAPEAPGAPSSTGRSSPPA